MRWERRNDQSRNKRKQQINEEIVTDYAKLGGQGDPLGIEQEIKIWPYEQMVDAQPRIRCGEWDALTPLGSSDTNGSCNLNQLIRPFIWQQKKEHLPNSRLFSLDWPESIIERKQKER